MDFFSAWVAVLGGVIVVGLTTLKGYWLQRLCERKVPWFGAAVHRDIGSWCGFLIGTLIVALWLTH